MSLKQFTPCDFDGICPYESESEGTCEWYCGADEPSDDYYGDWEEVNEDYVD